MFRLKRDIFNTTTKRWAEIKSFTTSDIPKAGIQFLKYSGFAAFGYYPDAAWNPSTHEAEIGGTPIIFWNCGGIIFYTGATDQAEDLFALSTYALARQYINAMKIPTGFSLKRWPNERWRLGLLV